MEIKKIALNILALSTLNLNQIYSKNEKPLNGYNEYLNYVGINFENNSTRSINNFFEPNTIYKTTKNDIDNLNKSMESYIRETYNSKGYANYISQNCSDLTILLKVVQNFDLKEDILKYPYTLFKLFNDKIKETELVDASMVNKLLKELPDTLSVYFLNKEILFSDSINLLKKSLYKKILKLASGEVNKDSELFNEYLNEEIQVMLDYNEEIIRFRQQIVRFLESILSKMLWSRTRYETFLPSFIQLGNRIFILTKVGILDHADDYDSLMKSLTCAACRYLDLFGWAYPVEFFEEIEDHLQNDEIPFLDELQEQDEYITTKKALFGRKVAQIKARAIAYRRAGILQ